jgi:zinc-ribbon domain
MAYRWTEDGPAFEFPTPYGVENRLLAWRGWMLLALSLIMIVLTAWISGADKPLTPVAIDTAPDPVSTWPFYLLALVLAGLAALDLVRWLRQRTLRLARGMPTSLAQEVPREASGVGAGAPALMQALLKGELPAAALEGPYQSLLRRMGAVTLAPKPLQVYLAARVAHLVLGAGLLLVLALGALLLMNKGPALALLALLLSLLGAAFVARQAVLSAEPPFGAIALGVTLGLALLACVPLFMAAPALKAAEPIVRLGLPAAAAVALLSGLLFEVLGLLAARAQLPRSTPPRLAREDQVLDFGADPRSLVQEVDRELYRRWAEGVPNRRYAWQTPFVDRAANDGELGAKLLEESQPLMPALPVQKKKKATGLPPGAVLLKALAACGLLWALAGGVLWLWLAYSKLKNPAAAWWPGAMGLACLAGAGYALRIGHLLWSRIEVQSTMTWIEFKGRFVRLAGAAPSTGPERSGAQRNDKPVRSDELTLHTCVAKMRSVFYAAAEPGLGGRALLDWRADREATEGWVSFIETFARGGEAPPKDAGATRAKPIRPAQPVQAAQAADTELIVQAMKRPARFCSHCGTPVLAGARFCQHCGKVLTAD